MDSSRIGSIKAILPVVAYIEPMLYVDIRLKAPTLGEDPAVIQKILAHLNDNLTSVAAGLLPDCRDPPMRVLV